MTWDELKAALIEACLPETMFEVLCINVIIWCGFFMAIGLGG